jgi:hypothetical protein
MAHTGEYSTERTEREQMTEAIDPLVLAEARARRLAMIVDGYEVGDEGMPDGSVPGAARVEHQHAHVTLNPVPRSHPRYVLVTRYGDHGDYRLRLGADVPNVEQLAADAQTDAYGAELIVCYFDLDQLAGDEQLPPSVVYDGWDWMVHGREYVGGEPTSKWVLKRSPTDQRRSTYDWATVDPSECDLGDWEDERMPVRYGLAKVVVSVVFNTVPSP